MRVNILHNLDLGIVAERFAGGGYMMTFSSVIGHSLVMSEGKPDLCEKDSTPGKEGDKALHVMLSRLLDCLPEEYRLPIWFYCCEKMSSAEVATVLCLPEGSVRDRVGHGMEMLLESLARVGVSVRMGELVGVLRALPVDMAPLRLMDKIVILVKGGKFPI